MTGKHKNNTLSIFPWTYTPIIFLIDTVIDQASRITAVPTAPHITASLASFILPASPWAVTNLKPAKTKAIITTATATAHRKIRMASRILPMAVVRLTAPGNGGAAKAKTEKGRTNEATIADEITNFLFIINEFILSRFHLK